MKNGAFDQEGGGRRPDTRRRYYEYVRGQCRQAAPYELESRRQKPPPHWSETFRK